MVSPDVPRLSPFSDRGRQPLHVNSSSPDLPPLRDVLAAEDHNELQRRNGDETTIVPMNGTPGFVSARHMYSSESTLKVTSAPLSGISVTPAEHNAATDSAAEIPTNGGFMTADSAISNQQDDDIVVVKITGKSSRKPRQPKVPKPAAPKRTKSNLSAKSQASKASVGDKVNDDTEVKSKAKKKRTGTMSSHFPPAEEPGALEKLDKVDVNEPLHLEQAPARRLDWTPPAQKTVVNIDSDSSAFKTLGSSEADQPLPIFRNLVGGYACPEEPLESACRTAQTSDEDTSFLKKRKRIELLTTKGASPSVAEPEKSPTKRPPKKKKPRTITELATAAYRVPSQPDPEPVNPSILDHFSTINNDAGSATDAQPKNPKNKSKQRHKTTKAPKKKAAPKPVLLSPSAALAQVANQDFVFGTSSQLAREESPTVLRDLQAALRQSTQNDDIGFAIPIHSDGIEPQQQRSKLWDAAARDAEGALFDVEVINLADDTSLLPEEGDGTNPFGYNAAGDESIIMIESHAPDVPNPSIELPKILASPGERAMHASEGGSPYFSDSEISVSTNIGPPGPEHNKVIDVTLATPKEGINTLPALPPQPSRPNYEGFTDLRLAKEIKKFGFKPIKRRSAMIALLDQCWQSKARMGQASFHATAQTPSAAPKTTKATKTKTSPKVAKSPPKARGRPRRNSPSASEPQEPPPSAQPPETPKRRPGRPRKNSLSSSPDITSPSKRKSASPSRRNLPSSSRRGKASQTSVIEIPDSEDNGSDFASSPQSDPRQTFSSPAQLDMSITTNEGAESVLAVTQTEEEVAVFEHITNAVKSAPRTTDPQAPSWNEKILLYEPIILEDFATWLNTGELSRVGYDGEVNPNDVKKWCESKSVCCVARVSLRGKERKRF
ncbi:structure-specific endonuclease subunit slx4 [Fusarium longipes]|uniref:Structure-specific endonuclease subunit SLX4 n=1 Tax=Fusarium longipes TaxID=694270 RepID=A0A395RX70_9HYPO|nr:structure-specific endonuclease subunit slx4 [Fusarium longipes]